LFCTSGKSPNQLNSSEEFNDLKDDYLKHLSPTPNPADKVVNEVLDDEHLTLGEANNIRRANTDENLVVTVDASKLEVLQSTAFNKKGRAKGKVTGDDWYVHGSVTLQMDLNTGQVQIVEGQYNFEWRDDRSLIGNLATVGGERLF
jgi:hypothetical protein